MVAAVYDNLLQELEVLITTKILLAFDMTFEHFKYCGGG